MFKHPSVIDLGIILKFFLMFCDFNIFFYSIVGKFWQWLPGNSWQQ
jgi:hypothetical protein